MLTSDYAATGPLTSLTDVAAAALDVPKSGPVDICRPVRALILQPRDAERYALPPARFATNQIRPARALIEALLDLEPYPLDVARAPERRIVGTCRHFAVLACALLRHRGVPARARCGFATYFQPGRGLDHWIVEYRDPLAGRWIRVDAEILGGEVLDRDDDLQPGDFLTGGEAWQAYRRGEIDAATFGVFGTENWGPAEIQGNAMRDLAALNKIEMLPWDEWGRMTDAYAGTAGPEHDLLIDEVAAVCAEDDPAAVARLYARPDLVVPASLVG